MQPSDIIPALSEKVSHASESGELFLFPSVVHEHQEIGLQVRLPQCVGHRSVSCAESVRAATVYCVAEKACGSQRLGTTLPLLRI